MKKTLVAFGLVLVGMASPAAAASITIVQDPGTTYVTSGLTGFSTMGSMMGGMLVTVTDVNGGITTATWAPGAPGCGAASGAGWSVSECGDTFDLLADGWTLTSNIEISSVLIDAGAGDSVFDITFLTLGTDGSSAGMAFGSFSNAFDITATYINAVALTGNAPVGDLFQKLKLDFGQQPFTGTLAFRQDTDSLASPLQAEVPEPASLLLLGTGLIGVARARARARKR